MIADLVLKALGWLGDACHPVGPRVDPTAGSETVTSGIERFAPIGRLDRTGMSDTG